ncbi:MAG: DUF4295 family protein [Bacteroidota bacterium]|nr:DUF4295 family protein [Bacteroidota bacterium]
MAKKVIAGLKKATEIVRVIVPVKTASGHYKFKEEIIGKSRVDEFVKNNS